MTYYYDRKSCIDNTLNLTLFNKLQGKNVKAKKRQRNKNKPVNFRLPTEKSENLIVYLISCM